MTKFSQYEYKLQKTIENNCVHFSSKRTDWRTPKKLYEELNEEFNFTFDPCPYEYDKSWNGLLIPWDSVNFINPPYGREIGKWLKKGYEESLLGKICVFLLPSRTDTKWWHEYVMKSNEVRFIKGRLKFDDCDNSAPFPSCIVIFGIR